MALPHAPPPTEPPPPDAALFGGGGGGSLLVRAPPGLPDTLLAGAGPGNAVPLEGGMSPAVAFETDLFKGHFKVLFKVPPEQQSAAAAELLRGRKRRMWVMVQGRVKRPVPLDDLMYGSWFLRPLRFPAPVIVAPALQWLSRRFGASLQLQLRGDSPCVTGTLCGAVQMLNVSRPGEEPDLVAAQEDTRLLLGPEPKGPPMAAPRRKAYFRKAAHRAGREFTPDHVITLHCYDHSFNYNNFRMAVPPCFHLDMVKVLDAQPVCIQLQDRRTGDTVFRFEVRRPAGSPYPPPPFPPPPPGSMTPRQPP
ncbi:MAG: hypothetical protein J3K34DRAFT_233293 [Monoraphidium minutum]|nr:MAG: hypothetical protein J3K34DRAFT_233293 [Monoraphidium minutum]